MQHLSYEEIERFLDTDDYSDEYLLWFDEVMEHLDECEFCQNRIENMRTISFICAEENTDAVFELLQKEQSLRMQYAAQKLEQLYQEKRMKEVAERLKNGLLLQSMFIKQDFLRRQSVMRGTQEANNQEKVQVYYEDGKIVMYISCKKEEKVTVVLVRKDDLTIEPEMVEAVWSEEENAAIAEFLEEELGEEYEAFIDIQAL